jgi:hypothetical protein
MWLSPNIRYLMEGLGRNVKDPEPRFEPGTSRIKKTHALNHSYENSMPMLCKEVTEQYGSNCKIKYTCFALKS